MENKQIRILNKLKEYSDSIIVILLLCIPIFSIIGSIIGGPQINESSLEELYNINNQLKNLSVLEGEKFDREEELILNVQNIVDPNLFGEHYFLEDYVTAYTLDNAYHVSVDELNRLTIDPESIKKLKKKNFYSLDSLKAAIYELTKKISNTDTTTTSKFSYSTDTINNHHIKNLEDFVLSDYILDSIHTIIDIQYETMEALSQALRKTIGIDNFNKHSTLILSCSGTVSTWKKTVFKFSIILFAFAIIIRLVSGILLGSQKKELEDKEIKENIETAKANINEQPDKILPVWDLANTTLQQYYQKNLSQVNSIFKLSVVVMFVGFVLIVLIIVSSIFYKVDADVKSIGIIAGIITEFIGATFLFIYKATIKQALEHSKSLEDMNNVGMSIKIIESIESSHENQDKIENAKIEIAKKLLKSS